MFSPCIQCVTRNNKQYSKECDSTCEYAFYMKILKNVLLTCDGCVHCKHRNYGDTARPNWCDINGCENYEKYKMDINKVIEDYQLLEQKS